MAQCLICQYVHGPGREPIPKCIEVNRIAKLLVDTWADVEPDHEITKHPVSYVATFVDLAVAIYDDQAKRSVDVLDPPGGGPDPAVLTPREREVTELLASGYRNVEIAELLQISVKTVDTHRMHIMRKLKLRNNSELTRFAIARGLPCHPPLD